jgi:hypothetical protein
MADGGGSSRRNSIIAFDFPVSDWKMKCIRPHLFELPDDSKFGFTTSVQFDSNLELFLKTENGNSASIYVEILFHLNAMKLFAPISTPARLNPGKLVTPMAFTEIDQFRIKNSNFEMLVRV